MTEFSSSPPQHQVFINFCDGQNVQLYEFVYNLVEALKTNKINVYVDMDEYRGQKVQGQLKKIVESRIALVIFSGKYTESSSCLKELTKINEYMKKGKLVAIPIFFKLDKSTVQTLRGQFGDAVKKASVPHVTKTKWKEALQLISKEPDFKIDRRRVNPDPKSQIIETIVERVKEKMNEITLKDSQKAKSTIGIKQSLMKICCLLLIIFSLHEIAYMRASLDNSRTKNPKDKYIDHFYNSTFTNSSIQDKFKPPNIQVFVNFRGAQLRNNFISYLVDALQRNEVNVFVDKKQRVGDDLQNLFKRIEESGIAIVVFSSRYTESEWCLNELVKIKERAQEDLLKVFPIYYKVPISDVKRLKGTFGDHFRDKEFQYESDQAKIKQWKEAIAYITQKHGIRFGETSNREEADFVRTVVEELLRILQDISIVKSNQSFRPRPVRNYLLLTTI